MKKPIILFDPGHGGKDPGATQLSTGRKEADDVLKLYKRCAFYLSKSNVEVKTTRESDYYVELASRPSYSDKIGASLLISLHRNSAPYGDTTANGVEIWVHPQAPAVDTTIAQGILEALVQTGVQKNRGVKYGYYKVLTCKAPAIMIELGFMNNVKDNQFFDRNLDDYAKAIAIKACASLGVEYIDPNEDNSTPQLPDGVKGYRIVVAYNENPDYAEANLKKAKAAGFTQAYLLAVSNERVEKE